MAVRNAGGRWVVEFEQAGVRVFRRLPDGATKAQGVALEIALRREVFDRTQLRKAPQITLEACVDRWLAETLDGKKDQRMPRQNAEHLRPFIRGKTIADVRDVVRDATTKWRGSISPATINRRFAVLKASMRWAFRTGLLSTDVSSAIRKLPEPRGREMYLTPKQVDSLASAMTTREGRDAIVLLAYTGMRCGELLALQPQDIGTSELRIRESKSGRGRVVPVPVTARSSLSSLPLSCSYSSLQWDFRAAREAAGLPHVRLHDLRHTCASWLVNRGVSLPVIARILGHLAPATTYRYAHVSDEAAREAMMGL